MLPAAIQNWLAERGYGQNAMPPGGPRRRRMSSSEAILRLSVGTLEFFGVFAFGAMMIAMGFFITAIVSATFSGDAPTIR